MSDQNGAAQDENIVEPANLKFLRRLVTVLTATMIVGILAIFIVLVMRLNAPSVKFPENLNLPENTQVSAITKGQGYIAVVTENGKILILSAAGQTLLQTIVIE